MLDFSVLSDPTRQRILELLRKRELEAGEIAAHFSTARPGVSRHLKVLREHDLVRVRRDGQRRIYSLNAKPLRDLDRWLEPYRKFWSDRLDALDARIRSDTQRDRRGQS